VTGLAAIFHSVPHFRGHAQEIIHITRTLLGERYRIHWQPATPEQGAVQKGGRLPPELSNRGAGPRKYAQLTQQRTACAPEPMPSAGINGPWELDVEAGFSWAVPTLQNLVRQLAMTRATTAYVTYVLIVLAHGVPIMSVFNIYLLHQLFAHDTEPVAASR
jgi:hypothetical protein